MHFANKVFIKTTEEGGTLEFIYEAETGPVEYVSMVELPESALRDLEGLLRMRRQVPRDPDTR